MENTGEARYVDGDFEVGGHGANCELRIRCCLIWYTRNEI